MRCQRSELLLNGGQVEENGGEKEPIGNNRVMLSQLLLNSSTQSFHELYAMCPGGPTSVPRKTHKCCAYIANKSKYCARVNSFQAFCDINRDVSCMLSLFSFLSFFIKQRCEYVEPFFLF